MSVKIHKTTSKKGNKFCLTCGAKLSNYWYEVVCYKCKREALSPQGKKDRKRFLHFARKDIVATECGERASRESILLCEAVTRWIDKKLNEAYATHNETTN